MILISSYDPKFDLDTSKMTQK